MDSDKRERGRIELRLEMMNAEADGLRDQESASIESQLESKLTDDAKS